MTKELRDKNSDQINFCIHQMVITIHNTLEISRIKNKVFVPKMSKIILVEKLDGIYDIFKDILN